MLHFNAAHLLGCFHIRQEQLHCLEVRNQVFVLIRRPIPAAYALVFGRAHKEI